MAHHEQCRYFDSKTGRCTQQTEVRNSGLVPTLRRALNAAVGETSEPLSPARITLFLTLDDVLDKAPTHATPHQGGDPDHIMCKDVERKGDSITSTAAQTTCSGYWPKGKVAFSPSTPRNRILEVAAELPKNAQIAGLLDLQARK